MSGELRRANMRRAVEALIDEFERQCASVPVAQFDQLRRSVRGGFTVAVVGRVKAGKSTLVNALIGRLCAPTSEEERTRVVTEFHYGSPPPRARLVLHGGQQLSVPFSEGIPDEQDLPRDTREISHAEVVLAEEFIRQFVLVDTPGLSTTTIENVLATRRAVLGTEQVHARSDALVAVFRDLEHADEKAFLDEYVRARIAAGQPVTIVGVLTHADEGAGAGAWSGDPMAAARDAAAAIAARHPEITAVIPLAGKLAESARLATVDEADARALASVAAVDDERLQMNLLPAGIDAAAVQRVRDAIGDYGLRFGRTAARSGLGTLLRWLDDASGIEQLQTALTTGGFGRVAEESVSGVLRDLHRIVQVSPQRVELRRRIAQVRSSAALHPVREYEALAALRRLGPRTPADLVRQLEHLLEGDDLGSVEVSSTASDDEVYRAAAAAVGQARRRAARASGAEAAAAEVLAHSFTLLAEQHHPAR